jgi:hypothetical protein
LPPRPQRAGVGARSMQLRARRSVSRRLGSLGLFSSKLRPPRWEAHQEACRDVRPVARAPRATPSTMPGEVQRLLDRPDLSGSPGRGFVLLHNAGRDAPAAADHECPGLWPRPVCHRCAAGLMRYAGGAVPAQPCGRAPRTVPAACGTRGRSCSGRSRRPCRRPRTALSRRPGRHQDRLLGRRLSSLPSRPP